MLYGINWNTGSKKQIAKKSSKKKTTTKKFSQNTQDLKLGALLIKQGKITKMPMPTLAKAISRWNTAGRQVKLEDFIVTDIQKNSSAYQPKKKQAKKSVAKKLKKQAKKKAKKAVVKKKVATKTRPTKKVSVKKKLRKRKSQSKKR